MNSNEWQSFVVSSRIRLARNVAKLPFPNKLNPSVGRQLAEQIGARMKSRRFGLIFVDELSTLELNSLIERHLISPALASNAACGALMLSSDDSLSVMLNEEDHLRIQSIEACMNLRAAYQKAEELDNELISEFPVAYSERFGFLTSCPSNVGTGLRASAMLFLPALTYSNSMRKIVNTLNKVRITVRGIYGEGSKALGCLYQVSNQVSLGHSEEEILATVAEAVEKVCEAERIARENLRKRSPEQLKDRILRSYGILTNAYVLSTDEFMELFSYVRLGGYYGYCTLPTAETLNKLLYSVQPNTLQKNQGVDFTPLERDVCRAETVRKVLNKF
mgnify:FL=1